MALRARPIESEDIVEAAKSTGGTRKTTPGGAGWGGVPAKRSRASRAR